MSDLTERDVLEALHRRYSQYHGNGARYAVAEHVRSHGSFDARRTADMIAMDLWKTGAFELHGHEVKVSRSDWLRELKDPAKAAEFIPYLNRWWLAVADESIVHGGELPDGWGLLAMRGERIETVQPARRLDALPLTPTRLASFSRAVAKTAAARAYREGVQAGREFARRDMERAS